MVNDSTPAMRSRRPRVAPLRCLSLALALALASAPRPSAANPSEPARTATQRSAKAAAAANHAHSAATGTAAASGAPPAKDEAAAGGASPAKGAPTAAAFELYKRGLALYDAGDPEAALASFERAYAISSNHQLLFNIGQIHYAQRRFARARAALERYLDEGSSRVPRQRREAVQRQLAELEKLAPPTPALEPQPDPASAALAARGITVAPTVSSASATAPRRANFGTDNSPATARPGAEPSSAEPFDAEPFDAEPSGAKPSSIEPSSRFPTSTLIWTTAGALGALALAGAIATRATSNRYDELRKTSADAGARQHRERLDRQRDRVETLALTTDVLTIAALAAAGAGVFITLSEPDENPSHPPQLALGLGQVELSVEF